MGVLAEYVKSEADQLRAEANQREEAEREWVAAIEELYKRIREWIQAADGGSGLLTVRSVQRVIRQEARLGIYEVDSLSIAIGSRRADIVPRARHVVATIRPPGKEPRRADGMVEIKDGAVAEYYLYRLKEEDGDTWFIRDVTRWNANREPQADEPLDRDRFEAAILRVLK